MATFNELGSGGIATSGFIGFNYSYEGSGGLFIHNCAIVTKSKYFYVTFGPGDIAFSSFAAKNGTLEKICIKTVALNCISRNCAVSGAGCFPLYRDKYNSVWLDENLLLQADAIVLVQAFNDKFAANEEALVRNC